MKCQLQGTVITLVILRYLKQTAEYPRSLSGLTAFLRMNLFVKTGLPYRPDKPFNPAGGR